MWDPSPSKKVIELKNMENVFQLIPYESQVERRDDCDTCDS